MPSVFVTLVGGSPWGFRIQGGRGTGLPLRLSKVNPGSKAFHQGLLEGDLLKMVNGYLTDGLSQMDVQNIIKETGTHLTLEVERSPIKIDVEKSYTSKKTLTFNGSPTYGKKITCFVIPKYRSYISNKDLGGWGADKTGRAKADIPGRIGRPLCNISFLR